MKKKKIPINKQIKERLPKNIILALPTNELLGVTSIKKLFSMVSLILIILQLVIWQLVKILTDI